MINLQDGPFDNEVIKCEGCKTSLYTYRESCETFVFGKYHFFYHTRCVPPVSRFLYAHRKDCGAVCDLAFDILRRGFV